MGLSASSDEWCFRSDQVLAGLTGVLKLVDDIIVQAPDELSLITRVQSLLERCRQHGMTLSKQKLEIGDEVTFAGHIISASGIKPDPSKISALRNFPKPTDLTSLRSFLGLANQMGNFVMDLAHETDPLRQLLKKDVAWLWLPEHDTSFQRVKDILCSELVVHPFDVNLRTELLTDASRLHGIGFALVQYDNDDRKRVIQCGSRSLLPAESRYATIELECLAIAYGIQKCRQVDDDL